MLLKDIDLQGPSELSGVRVWNREATRAGTIIAVWDEFQDPNHPGQTGPYLCIVWDRVLHGNRESHAGVSFWWQRDLKLQVVIH